MPATHAPAHAAVRSQFAPPPATEPEEPRNQQQDSQQRPSRLCQVAHRSDHPGFLVELVEAGCNMWTGCMESGTAQRKIRMCGGA